MSENPALHSFPNALSDGVEVNKLFKIPAEQLEVYSDKHQKYIEIPLPHSHIGTRPVSCRLLSAKRYNGMVSLAI
jgi:hypothetical protein